MKERILRIRPKCPACKKAMKNMSITENKRYRSTDFYLCEGTDENAHDAIVDTKWRKWLPVFRRNNKLTAEIKNVLFGMDIIMEEE